MNAPSPRRLYMFLAVLVLTPWTLIGLLFVGLPKNILHTSVQPTSVHYDIGDPYQLWTSSDWRGNVEIKISRTSDPDRCFSAPSPAPQDTSVTQTNWSSEGVEVVYSKGYRLFIPKDGFVGGR